MTRPLKKLGFLTLGTFDEADPVGGHRDTIEIIRLGEQLGFDSAWLRHRHLQFGISSPIAVLGALSQATSRIELGTAVTPLGLENPFRLAEDFATVDVLSGGRVNPGFSTGTPMNYDRYKEALYPETHAIEEFGYPRGERFLRYLRGETVSDLEGKVGVVESFSRRIQPHSPTLIDRVWCGAGGEDSVRWAAAQGVNFLTSSVIRAPKTWKEGDAVDFAAFQREQVDLFRSLHPKGEAARVSQGLVVIPTDSATPEQARRYQAYRDERLPRTTAPQGPGMVFSPDLVGTSAQIAEQLHAHAGFQVIDEVAFALPFSFEREDYVQILTDMATRLGPALGWTPAN